MASSGSRIAAAAVWCCFTIGIGCGGGSSSKQDLVPAAPGAFAATAGDGKVILTWQPVEGASAYNLYWASTSGVTKASAARIPNVTSPYEHAPLPNGTAVYYVVTAAGPGGESTESEERSATPFAGLVIVAPSAPSDFAATAGDGKVVLTWQSVEGASTYNLYWASASGVTKASAARIPNVTSPYEHAPLPNGTAVYYVVTAVGPGGESAESEERSATPSANVPPCSPPATPVASAVAGYSATGVPQFTVTWAPVTGATTYDVYWGPQPDGLRASGTKVSNATSPYVHGGLTADTAYYYVVTARNACGEGPASTPVGGPTPRGLSAPDFVDVTCTPHVGPSWTFDVSWTPVSFANSYDVLATTDIASGNKVEVGTTSATTMAVTVDDCTTYTVAIPGAHTAYVQFGVAATACAPDVTCSLQGPVTVDDPIARCAEKPAILGWSKATRTLRWNPAAGAGSYWLEAAGCSTATLTPTTSCSATECAGQIDASCAGAASATVTPFVCSATPNGPASDPFPLDW